MRTTKDQLNLERDRLETEKWLTVCVCVEEEGQVGGGAAGDML